MTPGGIERRVDDISKRFAQWKNLPLELVDEILGYLLDDPGALKACSLTCKSLFSATRPVIHRRLYLVSGQEHLNPRGSLFSRRKRGHGAFERLVEADRSGLLRYTRHLTFKGALDSFFAKDASFNPGKMQEYLPCLRSITKLHRLTLNNFHVHSFIPVFNEHFGMFADTLRHLDVRGTYSAERQVLYTICQFPLLEDLSIIAPEIVAYPGQPLPMVTQSPPLRSKLILAYVRSRELLDGLAALPSGLSFRSLELYRCKDAQVILGACNNTVKSISYLWCVWGGENCESDYSIQTYTAM